MDSGSHPESGLAKSVRSDADFEEMGWHDATLHGLYLQQTDDVVPRLLLDLDYVVRWVHPVRPAKNFTFWVAPATLVFEQVWDLEGSLGLTNTHPELEIDDVYRLAPDDGRSEWPQWHVEGHGFDLRFRAGGFRQYVRQTPRHTPTPTLSAAERGGCCFTEAGFD
ncbi:hypothetical protein AB0442_29960 [Kitasatospora sp. NPDC085895]|uniref:hypothetical protein n=1 Tax=Kitasatospora sp. NPDC085895 TaxID=3155057 RepID=UPI00344C99A6